MTKKKVEKKSAWTKVEPINLNKNKKYVVQFRADDDEPEMAVIFYVEDTWCMLWDAYPALELSDIIAYIELPE